MNEVNLWIAYTIFGRRWLLGEPIPDPYYYSQDENRFLHAITNEWQKPEALRLWYELCKVNVPRGTAHKPVTDAPMALELTNSDEADPWDVIEKQIDSGANMDDWEDATKISDIPFK